MRTVADAGVPYVFVDKSLFIKDIIDSGDEAILCTRPRRFGKTTNQSMLYYYFSCTEKDTAQLFDGLKIQKAGECYTKEQGKYPTIFITFKNIEAESFSEAYGKITGLISKCYKQFDYLLDGDFLDEHEIALYNRIRKKQATQAEVEMSIGQLSSWLQSYHDEYVVLLIDEYDVPLHAAYFSGDEAYYKSMHALMRGFYIDAVKDNDYLYKCVLTGILQLAKDDMLSGLSNVKVYSFLDTRYIKYFGFTEEEVTQLFKEQEIAADLEKIKDWYNGYHVGGTVLYNPWSILSCLGENGVVEPYWVNVGGDKQLKALITKAGPNLHEQLATLLQGKTISSRLEKALAFSELALSDTPAISLLYMAGYVNATPIERDEPAEYDPIYKLRIPNKEVRRGLRRIIEKWIPNSKGDSEMVLAFDALLAGDVSLFSRKLQVIAQTIFSYYDVKGAKPEKFYHGFLVGLAVQFSETYIILSNREAGDGRADIILLPKERQKGLQGIILELKRSLDVTQLAQLAEEAYEQIEEKKYHQLPEANNANGWRKVGIAFAGSEVSVSSK